MTTARIWSRVSEVLTTTTNTPTVLFSYTLPTGAVAVANLFVTAKTATPPPLPRPTWTSM